MRDFAGGRESDTLSERDWPIGIGIWLPTRINEFDSRVSLQFLYHCLGRRAVRTRFTLSGVDTSLLRGRPKIFYWRVAQRHSRRLLLAHLVVRVHLRQPFLSRDSSGAEQDAHNVKVVGAIPTPATNLRTRGPAWSTALSCHGRIRVFKSRRVRHILSVARGAAGSYKPGRAPD